MTADYSAVDQRGSVHVTDLLARAEREDWPTSSIAAANHTLRVDRDPPTEPIFRLPEQDEMPKKPEPQQQKPKCICGRRRSRYAGFPDERVPNPACPFPGHRST